MKIQRLICSLLAVLMLTGSMTACAAGEDTATADTNAATQAATDPIPDTSVTEPVDTEPTLNLPEDLDFGGDEIVIISRDLEGWTSGEISVEKLNGDAVNDAVFERNQAVEERLHIKIHSVLDKDSSYNTVVNKVSTSVKSGTHEYDIMAGASNATLPETLNNTFIDLERVDHLNLDMPWWSQGLNDAVEYNGSRYAITGSAVLAIYRFAFVTIFNQNLFEDAGQAFLYEDVKNGTWTLDRQISLLPVFHRDNGNGDQDTDVDVYGLVTNDHIGVDAYWSSCRVDVIRKNADGEYEVVFDVGRLHDVTEKVLKLFHGSGQATYIYPNESADAEQAKIRTMFAEGHAAMATLRLLELEAGAIRNMKDRFGVVPMPKYDEVQDDYYTLLHNQITMLCIPTTIQEERIHELGAFMEALSYESYRVVKPAYYESTLRTKLVQDPESAKMLDLIVENIHMDVGILYGNYFDSFHNTYRGIIKGKTNSVSSSYRSLAARLDARELPKFIEKLESLSGH